MELKSKYPIRVLNSSLNASVMVALIGEVEVVNGKVVAFHVGKAMQGAVPTTYEYAIYTEKKPDGSDHIGMVCRPDVDKDKYPNWPHPEIRQKN